LQILENQIGYGPMEALNNSVELLEYKLAYAIKNSTTSGKYKIGFIEGHGELSEAEVADISTHLSNFYQVDRIDLPAQIKISRTYKAIIIAKPRKEFSEKDKFKIDQYIMYGGKVLWLVETLNAEMDSLQKNQLFVTIPYPLNLEDQLFKYGVRINQNLIQDLQCNPIPVVINENQTEMFEWHYFPVVISNNKHPIVNNLDAVMCKFANGIDTVRAKNIKKTILLTSSKYSRVLFSPVRVHLTKHKPPPTQFNKPYQPIAVLLEGEFESVFKRRLKFQTLQMLDSLKMDFKEKSVPTKMIVISDGDVIKNDVSRNNQIYPLGYYKFTRQTFANKDLILNCIEYLCDEEGLIEARSKEIKLRLLDKIKIREEKLKWQLINIFIPVILIAIFGLGYNFVRKRKYNV